MVETCIIPIKSQWHTILPFLITMSINAFELFLIERCFFYTDVSMIQLTIFLLSGKYEKVNNTG